MKKWKRVVSLLCALVCVLGMSVPAFAAVTYTTFSEAKTASGILLPAAFGDTVRLDADGNLLVKVSFDASTSSQKEAAKEAWVEVMKDWKDHSDYYFFYYFAKGSSTSAACFTLHAFPKSSFSHISNKTDVRNYYHAYFTAGFRFQFELRNSALLFSVYNGHSSDGSLESICLYPSSTKIYFFKSIADLDSQHSFSSTVAALSDVNHVIITDDVLESPEPQTYTLTVNYQYENGTQAAQPVTRSLIAGSSYEIASPAIKDYTADRPIVSGTMPERDLTIHVLYRKDSSGSSKPSGWFDAAPDVEWKDPFEWFDAAPNVEWEDPFEWFDAAPNVEWKDPFKWFDAAPDVEWWSPFPWGE